LFSGFLGSFFSGGNGLGVDFDIFLDNSFTFFASSIFFTCSLRSLSSSPNSAPFTLAVSAFGLVSVVGLSALISALFVSVALGGISFLAGVCVFPGRGGLFGYCFCLGMLGSSSDL
jgi:hypothetical protein